jgi:mannose-6-phosphate isomerase-like protein (cupin superfamily)
MLYVIKQSDAVTTQEAGVSRFHEYHFDFKNASLGVSEISGRYPESGYDLDEQVEQSWYVESGNGSVWAGGQEWQVSKGDMVHLLPGEKYWIRGDNLRLIVASSPQWSEAQHKHVQE